MRKPPNILFLMSDEHRAEVTGYELREDFAARAKQNVTTILGPLALDRYDVQIRGQEIFVRI